MSQQRSRGVAVRPQWREASRRIGSRRSESQRGSVLVIALLVTMLIMGIGLTAMWYASSGIKVSANLVRRQEALQAAEAGLQRAKQALLDTGTSGARWGVLKNMNDADCASDADEACTEESDTTGWDKAACKGVVYCSTLGDGSNEKYLDVPMFSPAVESNTALQRIRYSVYIRNDPAEFSCCDEAGEGTAEYDCYQNGCAANDCAKLDGTTVGAWNEDDRALVDCDGRILMRAQGFGSDGISSVMLETTIVKRTVDEGHPDYNQAGLGPGGSNSFTGNVASER